MSSTCPSPGVIAPQVGLAVERLSTVTVTLADLIDPAFGALGETSAPLQILGRSDAPAGAAPE